MNEKLGERAIFSLTIRLSTVNLLESRRSGVAIDGAVEQPTSTVRTAAM